VRTGRRRPETHRSKFAIQLVAQLASLDRGIASLFAFWLALVIPFLVSGRTPIPGSSMSGRVLVVRRRGPARRESRCTRRRCRSLLRRPLFWMVGFELLVVGVLGLYTWQVFGVPGGLSVLPGERPPRAGGAPPEILQRKPRDRLRLGDRLDHAIKMTDELGYSIRNLAGKLGKDKIPAALDFVEELPRTSVGKLSRHELRNLQPAQPEYQQHATERRP